jgi:hypothetical protein
LTLTPGLNGHIGRVSGGLDLLPIDHRPPGFARLLPIDRIYPVGLLLLPFGNNASCNLN